MRTVTLVQLPDCDRCKMDGAVPPRKAKYDSPIVTLGGTWGYLCPTHFRFEGNKALATKLAKGESDD